MLPLQVFVKQLNIAQDKESFAVDLLREKQKLTIVREPYYLTDAAQPSGHFAMFLNCAKVVSNLFDQVVLDDDGDIVCVGPRHYQKFTEKTASVVDWTDAYAEEHISGEPIIIYDYKSKPFIATKRSCKAKDMVPGEHRTYYTAVCERLVKNCTPPMTINNVLYMFNPDYYYHLIYTKDRLVLVSAIDKTTLMEVSEFKLKSMGEKLKLETPDSNMVVSYNDTLQYFSGIKRFQEAIFIRDSRNKFILRRKEY